MVKYFEKRMMMPRYKDEQQKNRTIEDQIAFGEQNIETHFAEITERR